MPTLSHYIKQPDTLDRDSLYRLRTLVAQHPGFTAARLLLLHNLFVLQDPTFGEELRRAAFLVPDRRVLFDLIEAGKYHIDPEPISSHDREVGGRTLQVIDRFLDKTGSASETRRPTVADATSDYAAFLLSLDDAPTPQATTEPTTDTTEVLMERFLQGDGKFSVTMSDAEEKTEREPHKPSPKARPTQEVQDDTDDSFFTETLAKIYIKQGRFEKAFEIISTLSANYPNKSIYFADQLRYLRKLIVNNNHKK
ncbi:MAG: tetratricopeptide repeat protein [Bacteroidaceae bacterium]|nr:tetratricopeptide repeat protein [Bacteroidaceae bacterium]